MKLFLPQNIQRLSLLYSTSLSPALYSSLLPSFLFVMYLQENANTLRALQHCSLFMFSTFYDVNHSPALRCYVHSVKVQHMYCHAVAVWGTLFIFVTKYESALVTDPFKRLYKKSKPFIIIYLDICNEYFSYPTSLITKKIKLGLWYRLAVCVSLCVSP
jgi:hypothetical protein